jgi:hypothetical protein
MMYLMMMTKMRLFALSMAMLAAAMLALGQTMRTQEQQHGALQQQEQLDWVQLMAAAQTSLLLALVLLLLLPLALPQPAT